MNRRDFVSKEGVLLGLAGEGMKRFSFSFAGNGAESQLSAKARWEPISEHVSLYRDTVNVGVIRKNGKTLLIDSGDASILREEKSLGLGSVDRVLYTHYHRDQCPGAHQLKKVGAKIDVPASEMRFFNNATEFWLDANSSLYVSMNSRPGMMVLRELVLAERGLLPGEILNWEGIPIRVVATPGHTDGSLSYLVEADGKTIAFSGDLIYGSGKIWGFYSLQKGFPGMRADY